ncbi:GGDEF domain-containing protein [Paenibacillus pinistramenti]|uniref:GGDEF domain-containing protein n=1 Tax=Paenibacillus pinistramenti TaxID=1768003 RepID=UPI001EEF9339|nr:GGDEF domain-containing protein [Paenibacillus pinistramenti]
MHRQNTWIRWFLKIYWAIIGLHDAAQLLAYWFIPSYDVTPRHFYFHTVLYPTLLMGAAVVAAEWVHRKAPKYTFLSLFSAGAVISIEIIRLNMDIRIISAILLLPIIASAIFFRLDLTLFTAALQTAAFLIMYDLDSWFRTFLSPFDVIAIPIFLLVSTLVSAIIIISGRELVNDLEQAIEENRTITKRSRKDAQTGLYNHNTFQQLYEEALVQGAQGKIFQLALLDIDNFKQVNDQYGHRTGDLILLGVSRIIRGHMHPRDIASRYGGEEFALLLFRKDIHEAYSLLERIRVQISEKVFEELGGRSVTISIGVTCYTSGLSKENMFEETDALLYKAKRTGKNKVVL